MSKTIGIQYVNLTAEIQLRALIALLNPSAVVELEYIGTNIGSEFLTYAATKHYLATEFSTDKGSGTETAIPTCTFYDRLNAIQFILTAGNPYWDATAAAVRFQHKTEHLYNIHFSRLAVSNLTYIKFVGYKFTY